MAKNSAGSKWKNILFWSIITAAFIGPGTVTTASMAGATYGYALIWALVFSIIGCIVLQEGAARITIASGYSLGEAIARKYQTKAGKKAKFLLLGAIVVGGIAYQAGNVLGAVAGIALISGIDPLFFTLGICIICSLILWYGSQRMVVNILGAVVAFMGISFIGCAIFLAPSGFELGKGLLFTMPEGSALIIMGLIGTTIVPYNLFLASGISKNQSISDMRFGIIWAIVIGGIISLAILIVGASIQGTFSFENLAATMSSELGTWAKYLIGLGLFAAGFTSSMTAPLAAAITAKSIYGKEGTWAEKSRNYRFIWGIVILAGLFFGISGLKPVPVIILAQAVNGILLPFIAIYLLLLLNDPSFVNKETKNSFLINIAMLFIIVVTVALGLNNIAKAIGKATDLTLGIPPYYYWIAAILFCVFIILKHGNLLKSNSSTPDTD